MKCKCGDWECPYVEETNGQCCIPEGCPEWQSFQDIGDAIYNFTKKEYEMWIDMDNKIGEMIVDMPEFPMGKIRYLDYEKSQE